MKDTRLMPAADPGIAKPRTVEPATAKADLIEAANYEEANVPPYILPDPLTTDDGTPVLDAQAWPSRRQEILRLFEQNVYGRTPNLPRGTDLSLRSVNRHVLGGHATRKQLTVSLSVHAGGPRMELLLYLTNNSPGPHPVGAVGAWAWGLSRAMDVIEEEPEVAASRVAVLGHSCLGRAPLWAEAQDLRFAMVISNNSGCAGASLARRRFGETVARITTQFPHWFCENYKGYMGQEDRLPVDQHELIALIAPRPVYIASAAEHLWADPRGEFLAARAASLVHQLLGTSGLAAVELPPVDQPVKSTIGYHIRPSKHGITAADWDLYFNFADLYLQQTPAAKSEYQDSHS